MTHNESGRASYIGTSTAIPDLLNNYDTNFMNSCPPSPQRSDLTAAPKYGIWSTKFKKAVMRGCDRRF